MSVSQDYPDLYCNEAADDVVSSNADNFSDHRGCFHENLDPLSTEDDDQESSIVVSFDSEVDQTLDSSDLKRRLCNSASKAVTARLEVVNWMLKVHTGFSSKIQFLFLIFIFPFLDLFI